MNNGTQRFTCLLYLLPALLVAACENTAEPTPFEDESELTGCTLLRSGFENMAVGTQWRDGQTYGAWTNEFGGYGQVGVIQDGSNVLRLGPAAPSSPSDTHAALVRSNASFGSMELSLRMRTASQLRTPGNAWEAAWALWSYTDNQHFYYLVLKPNGWELGKADPAYPGAQRFLATGTSPTFPIGPWHQVTIRQTGHRIDVFVGGALLVTFTDQERPYLAGNVALYTEDADARFDDIRVNKAGCSTSAPVDAGTNAPVDAGTKGPVDAGTTTPLPTDAGTTQPPPATSERLYGVTIDDVSGIRDITAALSALPHRPTARVVFDEFVPATDYVQPVHAIAQVADVMGEILDSFYVPQYNLNAYLQRTDEYLTKLGSDVAIWEVGNEINGEWLGPTQDVVAKVTGAYDKVKGAGKKTALTLYYNQDCWERADHEMFAWTAANIPARMKSGLDYVFISYYEDDCNGLQPNWPQVFARLATMFPNSKIGIGECGTTKAAQKANYVQRYYSMRIDEPRYVGGYFWWYFREDMVPQTKALWGTLADAMANMP